MFVRLAVVILLVSGLAGAPGLAQAGEAEVDAAIAAQGRDAATFRAAFDALQFAIEAGDAATVAALVHYPFHVEIAEERHRIDNGNEFLAHYIELIVEGVGEAILTQDYGSLTVGAEGVTFDNDAVRMKSYCTDRSCAATYWLITAINLIE